MCLFCLVLCRILWDWSEQSRVKQTCVAASKAKYGSDLSKFQV